MLKGMLNQIFFNFLPLFKSMKNRVYLFRATPDNNTEITPPDQTSKNKPSLFSMAALMRPSVTSSVVNPPKPSLTSSTAAEVTSTLSGLTGLTPSNLLANIQSGLKYVSLKIPKFFLNMKVQYKYFSFRGPLDLTRFPGGLPSPSSLLFPYLMNPACSRNFHHHWAQKGMNKDEISLKML